MNSEVSPSTINKLGSEVLEIRLRALKAVELQFKVYDHLNFNGPFLMKALTKWFDFNPICEESRVLYLIHNILKGDQRDDTICTLGFMKLKEKFQTIEERLQNDKHKDVLKKILHNLSSHEQARQSQIDTLTNTSMDEMSGISLPCVSADDLTVDTGNALECLDYIIPWEIPGPSDLNSLNLLKSSLRLDADIKDIMHAIAFLKTAIVDFPAEYFLQPPYIFQCLKSLLKEKHNGLSLELLEVFGNMTKALQKRVKIRQLSRTFCWEETRQPHNLKKTQISVGRYFSEVFQMTLNYFKDMIHSSDTSTTLQQEYHSCFTVMFALIDLVGHAGGKYHFNDILKDLGYLTKYFRKTWDKAQMDQSNRNLYINTLYLMSKIVLLKHEINSNSTTDTLHDELNSDYSSESKFSCQGEVNVWRPELETALFDFLLKQSYSEVYETLLKAVQIFSDVDVMTQHLLHCDLILKPAVELLREPFIQNNEEFITSSLTVIQTLSLHRSNDFVQRVFTVVQESVSLFRDI